MSGGIAKILTGYLIIAIPLLIVALTLCKASAQRDKFEQSLLKSGDDV